MTTSSPANTSLVTTNSSDSPGLVVSESMTPTSRTGTGVLSGRCAALSGPAAASITIKNPTHRRVTTGLRTTSPPRIDCVWRSCRSVDADGARFDLHPLAARRDQFRAHFIVARGQAAKLNEGDARAVLAIE